jgi:hypothetical protein
MKDLHRQSGLSSVKTVQIHVTSLQVLLRKSLKDQVKQRLGLIFDVSHLKHEPMSIKGLASEFAIQIMQIHMLPKLHVPQFLNA